MPACLERKTLLSGDVQEFVCDLLYHSERFGVLRYVLDRPYSVGPYSLASGDVTYALYWSDRPYTLYTWRIKRIRRTLYYFNLADSIILRPDAFQWRDLVVDILIDDKHTIHILDEEELPRELDPALLASIRYAKQHVLDCFPTIIREADRILADMTKPDEPADGSGTTA